MFFDVVSIIVSYIIFEKPLDYITISCSTDCLEILDSSPTKFQLKLKEAMHINWEKPNLNQQVHHVNLTLTLQALCSFRLCTHSNILSLTLN